MTINISSAAEAEAHAKKDLAAKLAIPADDISVLESAETVWPDTSLGMPEPGHMYAQMLTEGFRVILEAGGEKYEYHFGGGTVKSRRTIR
jgi:hypothetical protein